MLQGDSIMELIAFAGGQSIGQVVLTDQAEQDGVSPEILIQQMRQALCVMRQSVEEGLNPALKSVSGMSGGQAAKLLAGVQAQTTMGGLSMGLAGAYAMAAAECNACMGKIVAAPTAGSCGIVPGALLMVQKQKGYTDEQLIEALFTAAGVGRVIATRASVAGAEGGCQAECGSAAAMAAAALVELGGGSPRMAGHAVGFALMNVMGLVCDPVGGLVEVPCVYRNVSGVTNALCAADMALCGIECPLPADEVIDAMKRVGDAMPAALRETGDGGCAACSSCKR
jgi:L-serine dehydratase